MPLILPFHSPDWISITLPAQTKQNNATVYLPRHKLFCGGRGEGDAGEFMKSNVIYVDFPLVVQVEVSFLYVLWLCQWRL